MKVSESNSVPLSSGELERLKAEDFAHRKKLRLLQVRQQEREIARNKLKRYQQKQQNRRRKKTEAENDVCIQNVSKKVEELSSQYKQALINIGGGHRQALQKGRNDFVQSVENSQLNVIQKEKENQRHAEALKKSQDERANSSYFREQQYGARRKEVYSKIAKGQRKRARKYMQIEKSQQHEKHMNIQQMIEKSKTSNRVRESYETIDIVGPTVHDFTKTKFYTRVISHGERKPQKESKPLSKDPNVPTENTQDQMGSNPFQNAHILEKRMDEMEQKEALIIEDRESISIERGLVAMKKLKSIKNRQHVNKILEDRLKQERLLRKQRSIRTAQSLAKKSDVEKEFERVYRLGKDDEVDISESEEESIVNQKKDQPIEIKQSNSSNGISVVATGKRFINAKEPLEGESTLLGRDTGPKDENTLDQVSTGAEIKGSFSESKPKVGEAKVNGKEKANQLEEEESIQVPGQGTPKFSSEAESQASITVPRVHEVNSSMDDSNDVGARFGIDADYLRSESDSETNFSQQQGVNTLKNEGLTLDEETKKLLKESKLLRRDANERVKEILNKGRSLLEKTQVSEPMQDVEESNKKGQEYSKTAPVEEVLNDVKGSRQLIGSTESNLSTVRPSMEQSMSMSVYVQTATTAAAVAAAAASAANAALNRQLNHTQDTTADEKFITSSLEAYLHDLEEENEEYPNKDAFQTKNESHQQDDVPSDTSPLNTAWKPRRVPGEALAFSILDELKRNNEDTASSGNDTKKDGQSSELSDFSALQQYPLSPWSESASQTSAVRNVMSSNPKYESISTPVLAKEKTMDIQKDSGEELDKDKNANVDDLFVDDPHWKNDKHLADLASRVNEYLDGGSALMKGEVATNIVANDSFVSMTAQGGNDQASDVDDLIVEDEGWKTDANLAALASQLDGFLAPSSKTEEGNEGASLDNNLDSSISTTSFSFDELEGKLMSVLNALKSVQIGSPSGKVGIDASNTATEETDKLSTDKSDSFSVSSAGTGLSQLRLGPDEVDSTLDGDSSINLTQYKMSELQSNTSQTTINSWYYPVVKSSEIQEDHDYVSVSNNTSSDASSFRSASSRTDRVNKDKATKDSTDTSSDENIPENSALKEGIAGVDEKTGAERDTSDDSSTVSEHFKNLNRNENIDNSTMAKEVETFKNVVSELDNSNYNVDTVDKVSISGIDEKAVLETYGIASKNVVEEEDVVEEEVLDSSMLQEQVLNESLNTSGGIAFDVSFGTNELSEMSESKNTELEKPENSNETIQFKVKTPVKGGSELYLHPESQELGDYLPQRKEVYSPETELVEDNKATETQPDSTISRKGYVIDVFGNNKGDSKKSMEIAARLAERSQKRLLEAKAKRQMLAMKKPLEKSTKKQVSSKVQNNLGENNQGSIGAVKMDDKKQKLLSRLAAGEKVKLSPVEIRRRNQRLYNKLPEVQKQKEVEEKRKLAIERRLKMKKYEKQRRDKLKSSR